MTAVIFQRAASMHRPGHRQSISPIVSHQPVTAAGQANRIRRLRAEIGCVEKVA